ncbi:MAG: RtcB family protein, partial [Pyrinomonadaceae bacterium]
VLIPGSNKDFSYILQPLPGAVKSGYSVNHGAGRRLSRSQAAKTLSQRAIDDEYAEAGILVNVDGHVPIDESSECYKSSEDVIKAVVDAALAEIQHKLWPLASLKGVEERPRWRKKKPRRADRKSSAHF